MRVNLRASFTFILAAGLAVTPAFAARVHRAPTSGHTRTHRATKTAAHKFHGQQAIDSERVTAIQQALIREHYLTGEPSSKWDGGTQAAMIKFQADQGWQTKITPDSRALIKLGLGPNHTGAINASASTSFTAAGASAANDPQSQGFLAGSGANH